jgi:vacuolar-type H+-ATPase subunit I/STV1
VHSKAGALTVGTTIEWMRVLVQGGIWGVLMFLSGTISKRESYTRLLSLATLAFSSLLFGMMGVFEWRVLHGGIGVVSAVAIMGLFATALAERRAHKRAQTPSRTR